MIPQNIQLVKQKKKLINYKSQLTCKKILQKQSFLIVVSKEFLF